MHNIYTCIKHIPHGYLNVEENPLFLPTIVPSSPPLYTHTITGPSRLISRHPDILRAAPCCSTGLTLQLHISQEGTANLPEGWYSCEQAGLGSLYCVTRGKGQFNR